MDLIDYGRHLSGQSEVNMILPILQIKEELLNPYHTDQLPFETKVDNLKLFYLLSGEDPYVFREGSLAQVRIVQVKESMI